MKLELETGPAVKDPDAAAISKSLACVQGFAILNKDKLNYIQASGSAKDGFLVEYQEEDTDQHYQCTQRLSLEQATRAFVSYAEADNGWRTSVPWRREAGDEPSTARSIHRHLIWAISFEAAGFVAAAVVVVYYMVPGGHFPPSVVEGITGVGLLILGVLIPRWIFSHLIGAKCPTRDCSGKAFPTGANPIAYVCRSCKRSYPTEVYEGDGGSLPY